MENTTNTTTQTPQKKNAVRAYFDTRTLAFAAVSLAFAMTLSLYKIFSMPFGGSVTLVATLPILLFSYSKGLKYGLPVALIFSFLHLVTGTLWIVNFWSFLLDYILGFTALGLAGIFSFIRKKNNTVYTSVAFVAGGIIAGIGRYASSVLAGGIFWNESGVSSWAGWAYSFSYNSVLLVDTAIAIAVGVILINIAPVKKFLFG